MTDRGDRELELLKVSIAENGQSFRSLNQLMWQIPILAMTLTGGVWFGVARVSDQPMMQFVLLLLACFGNFGLIVVLSRIRFVMQKHLDWSARNNPIGSIDANYSGGWLHLKSNAVATTFRLLLLLASVASLVLLVILVTTTKGEEVPIGYKTALAYYEQNAALKVSEYDTIDFEQAHPVLAQKYSTAKPSRVLDIGAGSGRDARWFTRYGHEVTAIEPSPAMLSLAKANTDPELKIDWLQSQLPFLAGLDKRRRFDLIIVSAVWMHIHPSERELSLDAILGALASGGLFYVTLRLGPEDLNRGIYSVDERVFEQRVKSRGLEICSIENDKDLLRRSGLNWKRYVLAFNCRNSAL